MPDDAGIAGEDARVLKMIGDGAGEYMEGVREGRNVEWHADDA